MAVYRKETRTADVREIYECAKCENVAEKYNIFQHSYQAIHTSSFFAFQIASYRTRAHSINTYKHKNSLESTAKSLHWIISMFYIFYWKHFSVVYKHLTVVLLSIMWARVWVDRWWSPANASYFYYRQQKRMCVDMDNRKRIWVLIVMIEWVCIMNILVIVRIKLDGNINNVYAPTAMTIS